MKFKFGLESLLKHKRRLEEQAQREYMEAQAQLQSGLEEIKGMYASVDETRRSIAKEYGSKAENKIQRVRQMDEFILGMDVRIHRARLKARDLMRVVEEKQQLLIEASKEKKIIEKLKEKRWMSYKDEARRLEIRELDDMVTMRFKRRAVS